jgi:hypothetical protein
MPSRPDPDNVDATNFRNMIDTYLDRIPCERCHGNNHTLRTCQRPSPRFPSLFWKNLHDLGLSDEANAHIDSRRAGTSPVAPQNFGSGYRGDRGTGMGGIGPGPMQAVTSGLSGLAINSQSPHRGTAGHGFNQSGRGSSRTGAHQGGREGGNPVAADGTMGITTTLQPATFTGELSYPRSRELNRADTTPVGTGRTWKLPAALENAGPGLNQICDGL